MAAALVCDATSNGAVQENESVQEGLPSVSVSKLPSAVTVAGSCLAQTSRNFLSGTTMCMCS